MEKPKPAALLGRRSAFTWLPGLAEAGKSHTTNGHIGIYVSSKYQEAFAPKIAGWLKDRDQLPKKKSKRKKNKTAQTAAGVKKASREKKTSTRRAKKKAGAKHSRTRAASETASG